MKYFIAFSLLIVGITAGPLSKTEDSIRQGMIKKNERLVTGSIVDAIEDVSQAIKDAGLDPFQIEAVDLDYALPVPVLFNFQFLIENFLVTGLSNIVVERINYSLITNRLTFTIALPLIEVTLDKGENNITLFGNEMESSASGRFAIVNFRIEGNIRVSVGIITGISIRSMTLELGLGAIESELNIVSRGNDLSNSINTFLGQTIPNTLKEFSSEINECIEIIALDIINQIL